MSQPVAYKKAKTALVKIGWHITHEDASVGLISFSQQVSYSKGDKHVPLNLVIEEKSGGGSQILITQNIPGGLMAMGPMENFCEIIDGIV